MSRLVFKNDAAFGLLQLLNRPPWVRKYVEGTTSAAKLCFKSFICFLWTNLSRLNGRTIMLAWGCYGKEKKEKDTASVLAV